MGEERGEQRGLSILCIDGGGVRGLSSLLILSETMKRLNRLEGSCTTLNPSECFDIIAGTGTGAVSACMLGRLGMSAEQAISAYVQLARKAFSDKKAICLSGPSEYKGSKLREALKTMIGDVTGNKYERMRDRQSKRNGCKTIVFAMSKHNMNASIPVLFRSYEAIANPEPDCTIWEALYASMAHPDLFKSIEIDNGLLRESFVGGELGCSNPIAHVLAEVKNLYPDRHVSCVLSIGAGHARTIQIPDFTLSQRFMRTQAVIAMKNMATDSERAAEEMVARFQSTLGVYYRLNVDQGVQGPEDDWEKLSEVKAHTRAYLGKVETSHIIDKAIQTIKAKKTAILVACIDGSIQASIQQATTLKRCPVPTPVFTGREDDIQQVSSCVIGGTDQRRVCVVYGLGGAGKTQLALKTIEQNRDVWMHVLYVDASSREAIESALQDFAKANDIGRTQNDALSWLESCREPWLVVFDNVDHPSLSIHEYFPRGDRGSILITTRLPDMAVHARGPGSVCHISGMSQEEGLALLLKVARIQGQGIAEDEMETARELLKDLGHLALAIVHAGAYIAHSPHMSIPKYLELFLAQRQRALEEYNKLKVKPDEYGKSVYTTWRMCYDLLEPNGDAQQMFWLFAYLHHDGISEEIFQRAATNILSYDPKLQQTEAEKDARDYVRVYLDRFLSSDGRWDTLRFSRVISELASYSLIDFDRANLTYSVHVLVQDWARTVIPQTRKLALECTTILVAQSVDKDNASQSHIFRRKLATHVDKLLSELDCEISPNHAVGFAEVYRVNGRWDQQEAMEIRLKEAREREFGKDHPDTLSSINSLASTYWNQGRWEEALSLEIQVLDTNKRVLGDEHPRTLTSMSNVASTYWKQGRWAEAESLQVLVMNARRRVLGEGHPRTLTSMGNLASTYWKQGRWDEAETLQVQVLDARKQVLGEEHPRLLSSMANLACTYRKQGRWCEAESLLAEVLSGLKKVFGGEHPDTLTSMGSLASTYAAQGRWDEAEPLQVQVFDGLKRLLGVEHPDTLAGMDNLASTYLGQGRLAEAESLQVQVLKARKRILGEEHPDTLISMDKLACLYRVQSRWDETEGLLIQVVQGRAQRIGDQHPDTLKAIRDLEDVRLERAAAADAAWDLFTGDKQQPQYNRRLINATGLFVYDLPTSLMAYISSTHLTLFLLLFLPLAIALAVYMYTLS